MKSTNYELINPYIEGDFKKIFNGDNSLKAAKQCYLGMSKYIRSPIPKFHFTLKNMKTEKFLHFVVKEKSKKGNIADFNIQELIINHTAEEINQFNTKLASFKNKEGGRRRRHDYLDDDDYDDDDYDEDDLDEPSEYYDRHRYKYPYRTDQPILYYWYEPSLYRLNRFYVPHFVLPLSPLVEVELSSAFFG